MAEQINIDGHDLNLEEVYRQVYVEENFMHPVTGAPYTLDVLRQINSEARLKYPLDVYNRYNGNQNLLFGSTTLISIRRLVYYYLRVLEPESGITNNIYAILMTLAKSDFDYSMRIGLTWIDFIYLLKTTPNTTFGDIRPNHDTLDIRAVGDGDKLTRLRDVKDALVILNNPVEEINRLIVQEERPVENRLTYIEATMFGYFKIISIDPNSPLLELEIRMRLAFPNANMPYVPMKFESPHIIYNSDAMLIKNIYGTRITILPK